MASSAPKSEGDSRSGLWRTLRDMMFGDGSEPTLREQLQEVIAEADGNPISGAEGTHPDMSATEREMLRNMLQFGERTADDAAVPRSAIIAIAESASFADAVALFAEADHSRLPVYRETLDDVIGMLHVKDVFGILARDQTPPETLTPMLRQPLYVPQSMPAIELLVEMRAKRTHLAIVLDEYGGTDGLVTIEDLVEEIVGDIEDEHDEEPEALLWPVGDGCWEAEARIELDDLAEALDPRLAEVEEDVDTLGGLAVVLAGHVPVVGDVMEHPSGWRLTIVEADERHVKRLRLNAPGSANLPIIDPAAAA
jgi:CBS domain containing-hemolysin-like protein